MITIKNFNLHCTKVYSRFLVKTSRISRTDVSINIIIPMTQVTAGMQRQICNNSTIFACCSFHTTYYTFSRQFLQLEIGICQLSFSKKNKIPYESSRAFIRRCFCFRMYYDLNHVFAHIKSCTVNQNMGSRTTNLYAE